MELLREAECPGGEDPVCKEDSEVDIKREDTGVGIGHPNMSNPNV